MADNTRINPGVGGDNIATEDIGGNYKIPVVKIRSGANDVDGGDITPANPFPAQLSQGSAVLSAANPLPVSAQISQGGAAPTAANPLPVQSSVGNAAASATNPLPVQLSQGNALITNLNPIPIKISDGTNQVGTTQGRNADNQTPSGTAFQLDVSGPTALLNPTSNSNGVNAGAYDRQRTTAFDAAPAVGIAAGTSQYAIPFSTTLNNAAITASNNVQIITVTSATNLKVGDYVQVGGANPENIFIQNVAGSTISAVFKANHVGTEALNWFHYNVARDAGEGNNVALTGLQASMTYFFNTNTNLAELERSAGGELDGASGNGTAIAAEYECNSGSPGGGFFDRARSIQGKGVGSSTITAGGGSGSTTLTLAAVVGLNPGQPLYLTANGGGSGATAVNEVVYVTANYVPGTLAVTLQSGLANTHTNGDAVKWDIYAPAGPGLNGFYMAGVGIEEEALFDPVTGQFFIERAATQDAMPPQNVVTENPALWNGTTMDRARSGSAANLSAFSATGSELCVKPGNWSVNASATAGTPSASRVAGGAGVRHVCNSISITLATGATAQTPVLVNLRDGASGAGTVLQTWAISAVANGGMAVVTITDLNVVGSAATAMTLEFAGATAGSTVATVNLNGYDTV